MSDTQKRESQIDINEHYIDGTQLTFPYLDMPPSDYVRIENPNQINNEYYRRYPIYARTGEVVCRPGQEDNCPICNYFKGILQDPMPQNDLSRIVERMGGDPPTSITEDECIAELSSLSDREYLCGAYWMFKQIFKVDHPILVELSLAKSRDDMEKILREHGL